MSWHPIKTHRARKAAKVALVKARDLITPPEFWIKGNMMKRLPLEARDGRPDQAYAYCALGALSAALGFDKWANRRVYDEAVTALNVMGKRLGYGGVVDYNDHPTTTHADVLALYDEAIKNL